MDRWTNLRWSHRLIVSSDHYKLIVCVETASFSYETSWSKHFQRQSGSLERRPAHPCAASAPLRRPSTSCVTPRRVACVRCVAHRTVWGMDLAVSVFAPTFAVSASFGAPCRRSSAQIPAWAYLLRPESSLVIDKITRLLSKSIGFME